MKVLSWLATALLLIIAAMVIFALVLPRAGTDPETAEPDSHPQADHSPGASGSDNVGQPSRWVGQSDTAVLPDTLPVSLSGTSVPSGWVRVDSNGHLIPTPSLRQLFEYYLSAMGEESLQLLVVRIEKELDRLGEPARSEALNILGNYLDYKLALGDLEVSYGRDPVDSLRETERRMQEIQGLRRTWLDADTADAFFAREEAVDRFQLEQRRIAGDDTLTEEQRAQALADAERALPAPLRRAREDTRRFAEYEQVRQDLADNPEALRAWREEAFGIEMSQQLAKVEARQKAWAQRWQVYREERQALERAGLAAPEREAAIDALRDRYFSGPERVRAKALDSLQ